MSTWNVRQTVGAVGVAVVIAGFGGAAIAAAAGGGHHAMEFGMMGSGGPPFGPPTTHHADVTTESLHGEYVLSDGYGGFTTVVSQTGGILAISPASVTARSADGFMQTYVIREPGSVTTPPSLVGDEVTITATREGEAATVSTMRPPLSSGQLTGP